MKARIYVDVEFDDAELKAQNGFHEDAAESSTAFEALRFLAFLAAGKPDAYVGARAKIVELNAEHVYPDEAGCVTIEDGASWPQKKAKKKKAKLEGKKKKAKKKAK